MKSGWFPVEPATRTIHPKVFLTSARLRAPHSASETRFKVSWVLRDAADFAVLLLCEPDDFCDCLKTDGTPTQLRPFDRAV